MRRKVTEEQFEALDAIKGKRILFAGSIHIFSNPVYELCEERRGILQQYKTLRYLTDLTVAYVDKVEGTIHRGKANDRSLKMIFYLNLKDCRKAYLTIEKQFEAFNQEIN